jgi:hypothetical protein
MQLHLDGRPTGVDAHEVEAAPGQRVRALPLPLSISDILALPQAVASSGVQRVAGPVGTHHRERHVGVPTGGRSWVVVTAWRVPRHDG